MTRYLSFAEILELHQSVLARWGGAGGIRDLGALESALAQPRQSFAGQDLYPDITSKAAALCFSLVLNHPFIDGNKRTAFVVGGIFLEQNGKILTAPEKEATEFMLAFADSKISEEDFALWLKKNCE